jgi:muramoyltetrapeptide carboxypeptidase
MNRRQFIPAVGTLIPTLGFMENSTLPSCTPTLIKPRRLKQGDTIGLIVPASPVSEEKIQKTISNLEGSGFKLKFGTHIRANNGHLAGTDEERLADLHAMFADKTVDAVWCIRGGYGCTRLLPNIDYKLIKANPKIFIGYSDITALHQAIHQATGLVSFHGPVGASDFTDYTKSNVLMTLMEGKNTQVILPCNENQQKEDLAYRVQILREGVATGKLIGGNLSLMAALIGTKYQMDFKNKLVFIEDVGERPYSIDRMLTHLLQGSNLHQAAGIALGIFEDCQPKNEQYSMSLLDTLRDRLMPLNIPLIYGLSFGHISNQFTFPIGIEVRLDVGAKTMTFLESAVE